MKKYRNAVAVILLLQISSSLAAQAPQVPQLAISSNGRFLQTSDGRPFFWLGDTAWLLFERLDRRQAVQYLENRRRKGFNVVQVMVIRSADGRNAYGNTALTDGDPARPRVTPGSNPDDRQESDYWDHVDWIVREAAARGIYIGMAAAWGSVVDWGILKADNVEAYSGFLADRYRDDPNIVWLTGGDTRGDKNNDVWRAMAETLNARDTNHLLTFHPFGRTQSSTWFHREPWLDFNMFQSGHRRYGQDMRAGRTERRGQLALCAERFRRAAAEADARWRTLV